MTIGVIGAMQMEVDDLKWSLLRVKSVSSVLLGQNAE